MVIAYGPLHDGDRVRQFSIFADDVELNAYQGFQEVRRFTLHFQCLHLSKFESIGYSTYVAHAACRDQIFIIGFRAMMIRGRAGEMTLGERMNSRRIAHTASVPTGGGYHVVLRFVRVDQRERWRRHRVRICGDAARWQRCR